MTLGISMLLVFGILCAALHWLVARSQVMRWFWSRQHGWIDALLRCPSCSGFWFGFVLWCLGVRPLTGHWWSVVLTGALGMWLTPVFEAILLWSLSVSAVAQEDREEPPST